MSPKPDVSVERKNQIVEAAMDVFAKRGFKEATMDDIVAKSGLSKGALYWYFKGKDEIIGAILDYFFKRELTHLRGLVDAPGSAGERLHGLMESTFAEIQGMKPLLPIFYEFYALALRNKVIRKGLQHYYREYMSLLTPVIQQGIERGEFRAVAPDQVAVTIGALLEGSLLLWVLDPKSFRLEEQLEAGMEMILAGIAAPSQANS